VSAACPSGKAWETLHSLFTVKLFTGYLGAEASFGKDQAEFMPDLNSAGLTTSEKSWCLALRGRSRRRV
jgi:hypothetical protein